MLVEGKNFVGDLLRKVAIEPKPSDGATALPQSRSPRHDGGVRSGWTTGADDSTTAAITSSPAGAAVVVQLPAVYYGEWLIRNAWVC